MPDTIATLPGADIDSSIIDNAGENTLRNRLRVIGDESRDISIASAFFSLDALYMLADLFGPMERIRLLFGDDADGSQRKHLLNMLRTRSDEDLRVVRDDSPTLAPLKQIARLFEEGKIEARCYVQKKFHAKAYLFRYTGVRKPEGVIGSGNFTRSGLTRNVELNVQLTAEQRTQLAQWFEDRWNEAQADVVTEDLLAEVRRQIELYSPYVLYLKALHAWGVSVQDANAMLGPALTNVLDPHQEVAYRQALRILEDQSGVMICDGVGLGKSFVALALMETYLRQNKTVLLVAPKSILVSSWHGYLREYLQRYIGRFPSMYDEPMTWFGFDSTKEMNADKLRELQELTARVDVVVVDESHAFRSPAAARYKNLYAMVAPYLDRRKKVILMTATPINTEYSDLSAQVALTTHDEGTVGGRSIAQIRKAADNLDKATRLARNGNTQILRPSLDLFSAPPTRGPGSQSSAWTEAGNPSLPSEPPTRGGGSPRSAWTEGGHSSLPVYRDDHAVLRDVLERLVIQRSRKTCKELAASAGKELRFPIRRRPHCLEYRFGPGTEAYRELIALSDRLFRPGIALLEELRKAEKEARDKGKAYDPRKIFRRATVGIKLAAFSLDQYLLSGSERSGKRDTDEIHLARLVFTNALKQLESSPVAFQGILQSLATGLLARLRYVLGEPADATIAGHSDWVRTPLFAAVAQSTPDDVDPLESEVETAVEPDLLRAGDEVEAYGDEPDEWLQRAIDSRGLSRKLAGFSKETHEVDRWGADIIADLGYLRDIHQATLAARRQPDPKLAQVEAVLRHAVDAGKRVLVFSQSQRTAEYLERELKARWSANVGVARIDSHIEKPRAQILHAFCPGYNPKPATNHPSVPPRVDVLISTDVLAEGVNLQEAGMILNYDIHWNPVRLIQRIGRVDRRLNPEVTPETHEFSIENVVPPAEIETIIELVGRIEERTIKISRTLGLETSFLRATDDIEALKEFNAKYDGELSAADEAMTRYVALTTVAPPDPRTQALLDQLPPGAFGVWNQAQRDGIFAYFEITPRKTATDADKARFASVISRPYLALLYDGDITPIMDAPRVLAELQQIAPATPSANPSDDESLKARLKALTTSVRNSFRSIGLPNTLIPTLVCWIELRKG